MLRPAALSCKCKQNFTKSTRSEGKEERLDRGKIKRSRGRSLARDLLLSCATEVSPVKLSIEIVRTMIARRLTSTSKPLLRFIFYAHCADILVLTQMSVSRLFSGVEG